jgi:hypothetical protein
MLKTALILAVTLAAATPASATVDRATAVSTLAGLYNSADVCNLSISKAKVDAYRAANAPAGDALFNVDVFRATDALYTQQKSWTKDQTADYCRKAAANVRTLDMGL